MDKLKSKSKTPRSIKTSKYNSIKNSKKSTVLNSGIFSHKHSNGGDENEDAMNI